MATITVNGVTHQVPDGCPLSVRDGQVFVNGQRITVTPLCPCDKSVLITGACGDVSTVSGDVSVSGHTRNVRTVSGNVRAGFIDGNATTVSGNIHKG